MQFEAEVSWPDLVDDPTQKGVIGSVGFHYGGGVGPCDSQTRMYVVRTRGRSEPKRADGGD